MTLTCTVCGKPHEDTEIPMHAAGKLAPAWCSACGEVERHLVGIPDRPTEASIALADGPTRHPNRRRK